MGDAKFNFDVLVLRHVLDAQEEKLNKGGIQGSDVGWRHDL